MYAKFLQHEEWHDEARRLHAGGASTRSLTLKYGVGRYRIESILGTLRQCTVEGCERPYRARGFCNAHHYRWKRYGDPNAGVALHEKGRLCAVEWCDRRYMSKGYCAAHYRRWRIYGDPLAGGPFKVREEGKPGRPRRGADGYVFYYFPEHPNATSYGEVRQHTVVMTEHLGRPLRANERVHHKNGIRDDNRLENLELWAVVHPSGQRVVDLVAFARQLLETYDKEVLAGKVV